MRLPKTKFTENDRKVLSIIAKLPMDDQIILLATLLRETNVVETRWYLQWIKDNANFVHILADLTLSEDK